MGSRLQIASRFARLAYWLGPWAPAGKDPSGVSRRPIVGPLGDSVGWLYTPVSVPVHDAWLISPGLHFDGPDDPHMHRLASALASAGYAVLSPAIHDLMRLQIRRRAIHELARAFDTLLCQPDIPFGVRPGILATSIGSLAAIRLAASSAYRRRVSRVVTIGGYADPREWFRSLTGALHRANRRQPWDPRHQPAAFLTLIDHLPTRPRDAAAISRAWRRYMATTWSQPVPSAPQERGYIAVAQQMARDIEPDDRDLFLTGCGARPGGLALLEAAFAAPGAPYAYLDPRHDASRISAPLHLVHGVNDPVIPFSQLAALGAVSPHSRTYAVGNYATRAIAGALRAIC